MFISAISSPLSLACANKMASWEPMEQDCCLQLESYGYRLYFIFYNTVKQEGIYLTTLHEFTACIIRESCSEAVWSQNHVPPGVPHHNFPRCLLCLREFRRGQRKDEVMSFMKRAQFINVYIYQEI